MLQQQYEELQNGAVRQLIALKNAFGQEDWKTVATLAKQLHTRYNDSEQYKEAQKLAVRGQTHLGEAAAAAQEEAKKRYDNRSIVTSRVLEDDRITLYGTSVGTISYTSTLGATITIARIVVDKIEQ